MAKLKRYDGAMKFLARAFVLVFAAALAAAAAPLAAVASDRWERIEDELNSARLQIRDSDGRSFTPDSFIFAGPDGVYEARTPTRFDVDQASGLPVRRLPLIGGLFREELTPPPSARGAPVYVVGSAMALDLRGLDAESWSAVMQAAGGRRVFIISGGRMTVIAIRPHFRASMFRPAPMPEFGENQIGEAFFYDDALVIAPLKREFYGARPW